MKTMRGKNSSALEMIEASKPATKIEERILSKCVSTAAVNDDEDDEDGDGSKVSDNLRQKLVSKENKVVSKKLGKAHIIYTT